MANLFKKYWNKIRRKHYSCIHGFNKYTKTEKSKFELLDTLKVACTYVLLGGWGFNLFDRVSIQSPDGGLCCLFLKAINLENKCILAHEVQLLHREERKVVPV